MSEDWPLVVGGMLATISPLIRAAGISNPEVEARLLVSVALEWPLAQVWLHAAAPICRRDEATNHLDRSRFSSSIWSQKSMNGPLLY